MTPILYTLKTLDAFPLVRTVVRYNPATPFTLAYQDLLFFGRLPGAGTWAAMARTGSRLPMAPASAGAWIFERLSDTLVEAV